MYRRTYPRYLRCLTYLTGMLIGGCVFGWGIGQAADIPSTAELTEKYGLQVGMTIDTSNADLVKDLLPDAVFQRVKNGDYIMPIGKLDPPRSIFPDLG